MDITDDKSIFNAVHALVYSTHRSPKTLNSALNFSKILIELNKRAEIRNTLTSLRLSDIPLRKIKLWENLPDRKVVGSILSPACYLPESFAAALFFAWKYSDDFSLAVLSNAKVGGDNCHRGVIVGSMLAMQTGIPPKWMEELKCLNDLGCEVF